VLENRVFENSNSKKLSLSDNTGMTVFANPEWKLVEFNSLAMVKESFNKNDVAWVTFDVF
jgi:hypothetical protein